MLLIEHAPRIRGYAGCILVLLAESSRGFSDGKFKNISSAGRLSLQASKCVCVRVCECEREGHIPKHEYADIKFIVYAH